MIGDDVPSPIDLRSEQDARDWAAAAMARRPWRSQFFAAFFASLAETSSLSRILELGSGPGQRSAC